MSAAVVFSVALYIARNANSTMTGGILLTAGVLVAIVVGFWVSGAWAAGLLVGVGARRAGMAQLEDGLSSLGLAHLHRWSWRLTRPFTTPATAS